MIKSVPSLTFTKVSLAAGLLPRRLLPVRLLQTRGSSSLFLCRLGHYCFSDFHPWTQAKPHFLEPHWGQFFHCPGSTQLCKHCPYRIVSEIAGCHLYGQYTLPEVKVIIWAWLSCLPLDPLDYCCFLSDVKNPKRQIQKLKIRPCYWRCCTLGIQNLEWSS